ncbi:MAG: hypothetical protein WKF75_21230 [Singulisphaera sp.]
MSDASVIELVGVPSGETPRASLWRRHGVLVAIVLLATVLRGRISTGRASSMTRWSCSGWPGKARRAAYFGSSG